MSVSSPALLLAAVLALPPAPVALAGDPPLPAGFNVETLAGGSFVATVLADGTVLANTFAFGNDDLLLNHPDGIQTLFADGLGSLAGIAQSPVTGAIVVGDSHFLSAGLRVLQDLNDDGDALDAGENVAHPAVLPVMPDGLQPLPFDLSFRPGTDELYLSGSTPGLALGAVVRIAGGVATVYADGLMFAGCMAWEGDTLMVADASVTSGRVLALTDGNDDGDALDPGEAVEFAHPLPGASDLVRAADGSFYVSGIFGAIGRLGPDDNGDGQTDFIDDTYFEGFGFTANLTLIEGPGGFVPGTVGDGRLFVQDFGTFSDRVLRSAPHAALSVTGAVANNQSFALHLAGEPGSQAVAVFALDQEGVTLYGIGDLALGFGAPYLVAPLPPIGLAGTSSLTLTLHEVGGAVGLPFTLQGFALNGGEVGCSNALELEVLP